MVLNEQPATSKKLLNLKSAAATLDMPVKTLRNLINAGAIPYLQPVEYGKIYLCVNDLEAWIRCERKSR